MRIGTSWPTRRGTRQWVSLGPLGLLLFFALAPLIMLWAAALWLTPRILTVIWWVTRFTIMFIQATIQGIREEHNHKQLK